MTIAGIDSLAEPSREIIFIATAEPSGLDDQNAERIIRRNRANGGTVPPMARSEAPARRQQPTRVRQLRSAFLREKPRQSSASFRTNSLHILREPGMWAFGD